MSWNSLHKKPIHIFFLIVKLSFVRTTLTFNEPKTIDDVFSVQDHVYLLDDIFLCAPGKIVNFMFVYLGDDSASI